MVSTVVDILSELIAVPSVNPRLAAGCDAEPGEQRLTEWLARFCTGQGWRWTVQAVHPGRANFIALIPGGRAETLLWEAHQDTVSAAGMVVNPFEATVRDGRVYGRGACDVKGGLAAMLAALVRLNGEPSERRPNVLFCSTVNEECGFTGARELAEIWREDGKCEATESPTEIPPLIASQKATALRSGDFGSSVLACSHPFEGERLTLAELARLRPSTAVVAEPTELDVVVAHRGVVRWRSTVYGRAAHSSRPEQGLNAIYAMMDVVRLIEDYHRVELGSRPVDLLCGPSTACVTTIQGGTGPNTVPDHVTIDVDRRLAPSDSPDAAYQELVAHLAAHAQLGGCRLEHEPPWMQSRGMAADANAAWAERVSLAARSVGAAGCIMGVPYGTNAASIAAAGIPTVVFGPGSIDQAHTADEWIAIEQLERAVESLCAIADTSIQRTI